MIYQIVFAWIYGHLFEYVAHRYFLHDHKNFKSAFWRSEILNYKPFETWFEEGEVDLTLEANKRAKQLLKNYEPPELDLSKREELTDFVHKKKASMPDAFV